MARKLKRRTFDVYSSFSYYLPNIKGILMLLVMFVFGALLGNLVTFCMQVCFASLPADSVAFASMLISYPIMFVPPMLYASYQSRRNEYFDGIGFRLDNKHFAPFSGFSIALAVSVATLALSFVADIFNVILPPMPEYLEKLMGSLSDGPIWIAVLSVSVFAPVFEEWLCRGMVLRGLLQHIKPVWAIVISALFFALIHANPWQAIPAFLFGLLFGYVYYKTGSLRLTMLMHCVNNTFSIIIGRIAAFKDANSFLDVMNGRTYAIMVVICLLWVIYSALRFSKIAIPFGMNGNFDRVKRIGEDDEIPVTPAGEMPKAETDNGESSTTPAKEEKTNAEKKTDEIPVPAKEESAKIENGVKE